MAKRGKQNKTEQKNSFAKVIYDTWGFRLTRKQKFEFFSQIRVHPTLYPGVLPYKKNGGVHLIFKGLNMVIVPLRVFNLKFP